MRRLLRTARKIMGRKGIGKFSAFGIAKEIDVESVKDGEVSHFSMNYDELLKKRTSAKSNFRHWLLLALSLKAQKSSSDTSQNSKPAAFRSKESAEGSQGDSPSLGRDKTLRSRLTGFQSRLKTAT